jgi:hypothetical protein
MPRIAIFFGWYRKDVASWWGPSELHFQPSFLTMLNNFSLDLLNIVMIFNVVVLVAIV